MSEPTNYYERVKTERTIRRLRERLEKRDKRIAWLEKRVHTLESQVSFRTIELSRTIESSVTNALCNVRMIPVLGLGKDKKIVEIKTTDAPR